MNKKIIIGSILIVVCIVLYYVVTWIYEMRVFQTGYINFDWDGTHQHVVTQQYPQDFEQIRSLHFDGFNSYRIWWSFADLAQHPIRLYYEYPEDNTVSSHDLIYACHYDILQREYCKAITFLFVWWWNRFPDGKPKGKFCLEIGIDAPKQNLECGQIALNSKHHMFIHDNSYYQYKTSLWFKIFKERRLYHWILLLHHKPFEEKEPLSRITSIEKL